LPVLLVQRTSECVEPDSELCLNLLYKFFGVSGLDVKHRIEVIIVISIVRIRLGCQMEGEVNKVITVRIGILSIGNGGIRSEIDFRNFLCDVVEIKTRGTAGKKKRNKRLILTLNVILYCKDILSLY
jgi:hypothetical protein